MRSTKKRNQSRNIVAITLIVASFASAYILSSLANRTVLIWSARVPLAPGAKISSSDLLAQRVALPEGDSLYVRANRDLREFQVLRPLGVGELIPSSSVSSQSTSLDISAVPIKVHLSDLPADISVGEIVNLYHVSDSQLSDVVEAPSLVLSKTSILGINRKGENLGGDLSLTISTSSKNILHLLASMSSGHFVVVRIYG
ncbi:MAG: hypothetical protein Q8K86_06110 [Candidatus Nanopelagicaceae bacterium]|nr:hypothetical protein [Candidatus Nanopelagicaceae bacterium]